MHLVGSGTAVMTRICHYHVFKKYHVLLRGKDCLYLLETLLLVDAHDRVTLLEAVLASLVGSCAVNLALFAKSG